MRRWGAVLGCLLLAGCGKAMPVSAFAGTAPALDPVAFFGGHTRSWGVLENRDGAPGEIVETEGTGTPEGTDGLHMVQQVRVGDDRPQVRDWHMRRVAAGRFEATANDMVGVAKGDAAGRVFHWDWVLATKPGDPLRNVLMSQWMYLMPDGTLMNRTVISKLGVTVAEVSEEFSRTP